MEQKKTRYIKEEVRTLRKKVKQVEGSRSSIKTKNSEKVFIKSAWDVFVRHILRESYRLLLSENYCL